MIAISKTITRIGNQSRFMIFVLTCVLTQQCEINRQTGSAARWGDRGPGMRRPGEAPTGTLVVQINGLWYEARLDYKK